MWKDEIVSQVRQVREEYAARFNYDIAAMVRDAQARQFDSGHEVVTLPLKRPLEETEGKSMPRAQGVGQGR